MPGALLLAFLIAHLAVRRFAPNADPGLLPIVFVLSASASRWSRASMPTLAASQVVWLFIGVGGARSRR